MKTRQELIKIGHGTYGEVYRISNADIAIKRIPVDRKSGIHFTSLREIRILTSIRHRNIIILKNFYVKNYKIDIVLEYMPFDLSGLIRSGHVFENKQINSIAYQIIAGLAYIHSRNLIYRDLKPGNVLLDRSGLVKITDFGLTREINYEMTNKICSLWYRAPEILLGSDKYTSKADSWSLGCLLLEIKYKKPVFRGKNEIEQIKIISQMIGIPDKRYVWTELFELKHDSDFDFWGKFGKFTTPELFPICQELLRINECGRLSCKNASRLHYLAKFKELYPINSEDVHDLAVENQYYSD
ncbi:putative cell division protein kinase [Dictyocoela roeselum]|nr:putative cell division protein kinase [Dictyocoela roeselum]